MTNRRRREAGRERQPLMAHKRITLLEKEKLKEEKLKGEKIWLARVSKDNRKGASEDKKGKRQRKSSNLFQYQFSNYTFIHHTCKTNKSLHSVQINFSFLRLTSTGLGGGGDGNKHEKTQVRASSSSFVFWRRNFPPRENAAENLLPFSLFIWLRLRFMLDFGGFEWITKLIKARLESIAKPYINGN